VPLAASCSIEAYRENIAEMIKAGHDPDSAVAAAHRQLREACRTEGKPTPETKKKSREYLEAALAKAKAALGDKFAEVHAHARGHAGGMASGRARATSIEKSFMAGTASLSQWELDDAFERAEVWAAADVRRGTRTGGEVLAEQFWAEKCRREAAAKGEKLGGKPGLPRDKADPDELRLGTKEEMEHTNDRAIAEEIALDHLKEDAHYYSRAKKADRSGDPGVMIALRLPAQTAKDIALEGGEPAESLHVTLAYLGRMSTVGPTGMMSAVEAIGTIQDTPVLRGVLAGIGRFAGTDSSDGKDVLIRLVDVPGLTDLRARLVRALVARGVPVNQAHDFTPHLTLAYVDESAKMPKRAPLQDIYFDTMVLSVNDADTAFPLGQPSPVDFASPSKAPAEVTQVQDGSVVCGELVCHSVPGLHVGDIVEITADISGDMTVSGPSHSSVAAPPEHIQKTAEAAHDALLHSTFVPFVGPASARLVFVSAAPNELELARGEAFVGADGVAFAERYLAPLGVTKSEVAVGFACPVVPRCEMHQFGVGNYIPQQWQDFTRAEMDKYAEYRKTELDRWPQAVVVAIGKTAHEALGDRALLMMPHPLAARLNEDRYTKKTCRSTQGEMERKLGRITKALDEGFIFKDTSVISPGPRLEILPGRSGECFVKVAKAAAEKQIVYCVAIDPYEVDTQDEWIPPAVAEQAAHDYLRQSRVIGREHTRKDRADLVESSCVPYPSKEDYQKAMTLQPHSAWEMPYGDDVVHSGAWIVGIKLDADGWAAYKRGDITGVSIGGFSAKTRADKASMPEVTFVPLVPKT
jgi:uracil-DNA glycosylase/2'-5' RNA ligase